MAAKPLTDEEIQMIESLIAPGTHPIKMALLLSTNFIPRLLQEREYLIKALRSTESGSQAMTEFLLHLERYELLREENEQLKKLLHANGVQALRSAI